MCGYYRKYVFDYAKETKPLSALTKKNTAFQWSQQCQEAFDELKPSLTNEVLLKFPCYDSLFYTSSDASDVSIAGIISQQEPPNDRPISYFSRTLSDTQRRYSTIEKELLAILESVKEFHTWIYGRFFIIITDHKPLCFIFSTNDINSRLFRQKLQLLNYNYKIIHRPGKLNVVADALSRISMDSAQSIEEILEEQKLKPVYTVSLGRTEMKKIVFELKLEQKAGILTKLKDFDGLFFLVSSTDSHMFTKLQKKFSGLKLMKQWQQIEGKYFVKSMKLSAIEQNNKAKMRECLQFIKNQSEKTSYERIAININLDTLKEYLSHYSKRF